MKFFYSDSCFLITSYQIDVLDLISKYKYLFYISRIQVLDELIYPKDLQDKVLKSLSIIDDNDEIIRKTYELKKLHTSLSYYDCLSLSHCILEDYCLVTNDKHLIKCCNKYRVKVATADSIINILISTDDIEDCLKEILQ